jgi:hypothetical protein
MARIIHYILLGCFSFSLSAYTHPVHISVTNIDFLPESKKLDIAVKVFTADMEYAIAHNYNVLPNIGKQNEISDLPNYIDKYFNATFAVILNRNLATKLDFKRNETVEGYTWFYFEVPVPKKTKKIVFKNAILFDMFFDQTNLLIIADEGKETGTKTTFYQRDYIYITKRFSK